MNPLKIVLVAVNCFPNLGPRSHRATELAKELAKRDHTIYLYALLGNYDYTELVLKPASDFKDMGKPKFSLSDNAGYKSKSIFFRIIRKTAN